MNLVLKETGATHQFLVKQDDVVVGDVWLCFRQHYIYISYFNIKEEFRSRGIGTKVLDELKTWPCKIKLAVDVANYRAVKFYHENGFTIKETKDGFHMMWR